MAEEALAKYQKAFGWHEEDGCKCAPCALSRLLAAEPAKGADLTITGIHDNCDRCKQPIPNGCYAVLCSACDNLAEAALSPAPPAGAGVREAAEANDDCEVPGVCRACTPLVNEEISRWQARIEEVITRAGILPYDASGNESGDPLDYSADQIEVALGASAALRGGQKGEGR